MFPFLVCLTLSPAQPPAPRLPHDNLLIYRGEDGQPRPMRTADDWRLRRAEILAGFAAVAGTLPGAERRCPLDLRVEEEADCGGYVRRRVSYASEPGGRVPAWLLVPKAALNGGPKAPGVLCLHPTNNTIGAGVVVGLGG